MRIRGKDIQACGFQPGPLFGEALRVAKRALADGVSREEVLFALRGVADDPASWIRDERYGGLACELLAETRELARRVPELRAAPVPCAIWGREAIEPGALAQMDHACRLPVTVAGALMPDAHVGFGVPIGGVVATRGAVIPYAVGVDIACRMRLSIVDMSPEEMERHRDTLCRALRRETAFGVGAEFRGRQRRDHGVLSDDRWDRLEVPKRRALFDTAAAQLGTSGSGNHFVEFGEISLHAPLGGLAPGRHVALLSHSGSRGLGARLAGHFTRVAMAQCRLPPAQRHLAWLELGSDDGVAYWEAMELAGAYAQANHELIHRHVLAGAGLHAVASVENHHNFAWKERHGGEDLVVHRKGATPAAAGVLGIIPGSMAAPGFLVRGRGEAASLHSASHGAGRQMSRRAALESISKGAMRDALARAGVELLGGGRDEAPQAYKSIDEVMAAQRDLVDILGVFWPRLVLMSGDETGRDI